LNNSKRNVDRLGFFEEVQVLRERVPEQPTTLNLKFKVKEKPTGQLNASLGFSPGQSTTQNNWTGQGSYTEQNQNGRGYYLQLKGTWNGDKNYAVDLEFSNPRVNDSVWSSSFALFYRNDVLKVLDDVEVQDKRYGGSVGVGRKIFELVRGNITYKASHISQTSDKFLLDRYIENAIASSVITGISRADLNNYIDPSEGSRVGVNQQFTGGPVLKGTQRYMESSAYGTYFYPVDFTETFRTYFKLSASTSFIYPLFTHRRTFRPLLCSCKARTLL
jgi:outer membrane protein insertion porin family